MFMVFRSITVLHDHNGVAFRGRKRQICVLFAIDLVLLGVLTTFVVELGELG